MTKTTGNTPVSLSRLKHGSAFIPTAIHVHMGSSHLFRKESRRNRVQKLKFLHRTVCGPGAVALLLASLLPAGAQQALSWDQVKAKFELANPVLKADAASVDEMRAEEITAFLRPNPQFTLGEDGTQ